MVCKRRTIDTHERHHRFGKEAVDQLEAVYSIDPIPSRETRQELARRLSVSERQIQVWLQNKRQRSKARQMALAADALKTPPTAPPPPTAEGCVTDVLSMEIFVEGHAPHKGMCSLPPRRSHGCHSLC